MGSSISPHESGPLSAEEHERLCDLEAAVEHGLTTFVSVGNALAEIRDSRLYRVSHESFESYLRERWKMSRTRGYELISAADVAGQVSAIADISDVPEGAIRPLTRLAPETRAKVVEAAKTKAGDNKISSKHIKAAIESTGISTARASQVARIERGHTKMGNRPIRERAMERLIDWRREFPAIPMFRDVYSAIDNLIEVERRANAERS